MFRARLLPLALFLALGLFLPRAHAQIGTAEGEVVAVWTFSDPATTSYAYVTIRHADGTYGTVFFLRRPQTQPSYPGFETPLTPQDMSIVATQIQARRKLRFSSVDVKSAVWSYKRYFFVQKSSVLHNPTLLGE